VVDPLLPESDYFRGEANEYDVNIFILNQALNKVAQMSGVSQTWCYRVPFQGGLNVLQADRLALWFTLSLFAVVLRGDASTIFRGGAVTSADSNHPLS